jgi:hypothetical protein
MSGGTVDSDASRAIGNRVKQRMDEMATLASQGKGICFGCTIEQGKAIKLKRL